MLTLLKGSKGLETVFEFFDRPGETELSKYLSITYFILYILFIIWFYIPPICANTSEWSAGLQVWCLGPQRIFSCASDHPFVIERQVCNLSTKPQVSTTLHYTITVCCNHTLSTLFACHSRGPRIKSQMRSVDQGIEP